MNTLKLASLTVSVMILLSGCNSIQQDTQFKSELSTNESVTFTTITTDVSQVDTTVISSETITDTSLDITSVTSATDSTSESSEVTQDTTQFESTTQVTSDTNVPQQDTSSEDLAGISSYDDLVIPVKVSSDYITQNMCDEIAQYFNSMIELDIDTFKSKQIPAYNTFIEEYLEENNSSLQEMLSTYKDNFLYSTGNPDTIYSNVQFDSICLDYPNDFDNIMNTMEYINQLDEITEQYEQYILSQSLTAYYQLNYTIYYTLTDDSLQDYESSKVGSILVLDVGGDISLVMLY